MGAELEEISSQLEEIDALDLLKVTQQVSHAWGLLESTEGIPALEELVAGKGADTILVLGEVMGSLDIASADLTQDLISFQELPPTVAPIYLRSLPHLAAHMTSEQRAAYVKELQRWVKDTLSPEIAAAYAPETLPVCTPENLLRFLRAERLIQKRTIQKHGRYYVSTREVRERLEHIFPSAVAMEAVEPGSVMVLSRISKGLKTQRLEALCAHAPHVAAHAGVAALPQYLKLLEGRRLDSSREETLVKIDAEIEYFGKKTSVILRTYFHAVERASRRNGGDIGFLSFARFARQHGLKEAKTLAEIVRASRHFSTRTLDTLMTRIGWEHARDILRKEYEVYEIEHAIEVMPDAVRKAGVLAMKYWIGIGGDLRKGGYWRNSNWTTGLTRLVLEDPEHGRIFFENRPGSVEVSDVLGREWPLERYTSQAVLELCKATSLETDRCCPINKAVEAVAKQGDAFGTGDEDVLIFLRKVSDMAVISRYLAIRFAASAPKVLEAYGERVLYKGAHQLEQLASVNLEAAVSLARYHAELLDTRLGLVGTIGLVADVSGSHLQAVRRLPGHLNKLEAVCHGSSDLGSETIPFIHRLLHHVPTVCEYLKWMPAIAAVHEDIVPAYATSVVTCLTASKELGRYVAKSQRMCDYLKTSRKPSRVQDVIALYKATAHIARDSWRLAGALFQAGPKLISAGQLGAVVAEIIDADEDHGVRRLQEFGANDIWLRHNRPVAILWDEIVEGGAEREYYGSGW